MERISIPRIMQETSKEFLLRSKSIGFVPTMGALHEGHLSLIRRAKQENDIVVVSIFVNPIQFGPQEDFTRYPRTLASDIEKLESLHTDVLFLPDTKAMYPEGFCSYVTVEGLSDRLCGAFREGHFRGVATVVCKLINIVRPTRLYLGQKDYQQTVIIRKMVEHLNIDTEVVICKTVREPDGLAMSSRNVYLSPEERRSAAVIYRCLTSVSQMISKDQITCAEVPSKMIEILRAEPLISEIQYAGIFDTETLEALREFKGLNLLAIAVKIGDTRLIDNQLVEYQYRA